MNFKIGDSQKYRVTKANENNLDYLSSIYFTLDNNSYILPKIYVGQEFTITVKDITPSIGIDIAFNLPNTGETLHTYNSSRITSHAFTVGKADISFLIGAWDNETEVNGELKYGSEGKEINSDIFSSTLIREVFNDTVAWNWRTGWLEYFEYSEELDSNNHFRNFRIEKISGSLNFDFFIPVFILFTIITLYRRSQKKSDF
jgi:hypothetical protein